MGILLGVIKGDTRSLDYDSYDTFPYLLLTLSPKPNINVVNCGKREPMYSLLNP